MAVNEIRVVLTDDSGNSISSGQSQVGRSDQRLSGSTGVGVAAGIGVVSGGLSRRQQAINDVVNTNMDLNIGRSSTRLERAMQRKKGFLVATDKDLTSYERRIGGKQYLKNISGPSARQIKQATVGVTAGLQIVNIGFDIAQHNASIAGNTHKAAYLANKQSAINDISGIAIAAAINPVAGAVMLGWTVYRKIMEHDKFINEMKVQSVQAAYHAQRVGYTITSTGRVTV